MILLHPNMLDYAYGYIQGFADQRTLPRINPRNYDVADWLMYDDGYRDGVGDGVNKAIPSIWRDCSFWIQTENIGTEIVSTSFDHEKSDVHSMFFMVGQDGFWVSDQRHVLTETRGYSTIETKWEGLGIN